MADRTGIEWTGSTWTTIRARHRATGKLGWHCVHVSPGCKNCYAESWNKPRGTGLPFKPGHAAEVEIILDERMLLQPLRWREPRKIFVCSMTDLFAEFVPDEMIDRVFAVMALAPQHTFQVLTKRAARMRAYLTDPDLNDRISAALGCMLDGDWIWNEGRRFRSQIEKMISVFLGVETDDDEDVVCHDDPMPLPNVWLGVSAEDQDRADERVPELLATPAAVRFVSAEPLLGPIDFSRIPSPVVTPEDEGYYHSALDGGDIHYRDCAPDWSGKVFVDAVDGPMMEKLDQIIVGGESGPGARPMHPDWARAIRDQCAAAGTAFFFKQWGAWGPAGTFHTATTHEIGPGALIWDAIPNRVLAVERDEAGMASGTVLCRVGKKAAGRELDGVEHSAMPQVRP